MDESLVAFFKAGNIKVYLIPQGGSLAEVLLRRKFRIDTIIRDMKTGQIVDLFNGVQDKEDGVLSLIDPKAAIYPENILKGVEVALKLDLIIEKDTLNVFKLNSSVVSCLPWSIVTEYFLRGFMINPQGVMCIYKEIGILDVLMPGIKDIGLDALNFYTQRKDGWLIYLAYLARIQGANLSHLHLSKRAREFLEGLILCPFPSMSFEGVRQWMMEYSTYIVHFYTLFEFVTPGISMELERAIRTYNAYEFMNFKMPVSNKDIEKIVGKDKDKKIYAKGLMLDALIKGCVPLNNKVILLEYLKVLLEEHNQV